MGLSLHSFPRRRLDGKKTTDVHTLFTQMSQRGDIGKKGVSPRMLEAAVSSETL